MVFKGIIIRVSFLWVEGIALFPFVLTKHKKPSRQLLNHEVIHLQQQLEMGFILFYLWYLTEYLIRYASGRKSYAAYRAISFEREAYQNEADPGYLLRRPFWAFLRYI